MEALTNTQNSLGQGLDNAKAQLTNTMQTFSSGNVVNAGREFLEANTMIAKFVFIIFVVLLFMILFALGTAFITYWMSSSRTPFLVKGVRNGSRPKTISQDPKVTKSAIILRSNNENSGVEYTWSTWLRIDSLATANNSTATAYNHIFNKGAGDIIAESSTSPGVANAGIVKVNNSPGLYVQKNNSSTDSDKNNLYFVQDVVSPADGTDQNTTQLTVSNIPMAKWFHVAFRLKNKVLDSYVNGQINSRVAMDYIPKQNYDDVYIAGNGGFSGQISDLRYFDYALTIFEINSIVNQGPNLTTNDDTAGDVGQYDYLSRLWYNV
jgi:hypothetical protein